MVLVGLLVLGSGLFADIALFLLYGPFVLVNEGFVSVFTKPIGFFTSTVFSSYYFFV